MFERDPLSLRYDQRSAELVMLAIRRYQQAEQSADPVSRRLVWVSVHVPSPARAPRDRLGRTPQERAAVRSLYRNELVYIHSPDKRWSLKVEWGPRQQKTRLHAGGRLLRLRVFPDIAGARHIRATPGASYVREEIFRSSSAPGGRPDDPQER